MQGAHLRGSKLCSFIRVPQAARRQAQPSRCAMCLCIRLGCNRCREKRFHLPKLRQRQPLILAAPAQYPLEGLRSWRSRSSTCVILLAYAGRGLNLRGTCCAHRPGSEKVAVSFGESSRLINPPQIAASPKLLQSALLSSGLRALFADARMRCPALTQKRMRAPGPALSGGLPRAGRPLAARPSDSGSEVGAAVGEGCLHAGLLGVCDAEICEV